MSKRQAAFETGEGSERTSLQRTQTHGQQAQKRMVTSQSRGKLSPTQRQSAPCTREGGRNWRLAMGRAGGTDPHRQWARGPAGGGPAGPRGLNSDPAPRPHAEKGRFCPRWSSPRTVPRGSTQDSGTERRPTRPPMVGGCQPSVGRPHSRNYSAGEARVAGTPATTWAKPGHVLLHGEGGHRGRGGSDRTLPEDAHPSGRKAPLPAPSGGWAGSWGKGLLRGSFGENTPRPGGGDGCPATPCSKASGGRLHGVRILPQ